MLWEILQLYFLIALVSTILSFSKFIDVFGKIVFHLVSAVFWFVTGLGIMQIRFQEGGSVAMVFYDFTIGSANTEPALVWGFWLLGIVGLFFGILRAWLLVSKGIVEGYEAVSGQKVNNFILNTDIE